MGDSTIVDLHLNLGASRGRSQPFGQIVLQHLLGFSGMQRIESRLIHERLGNCTQPRLIQCEHPTFVDDH